MHHVRVWWNAFKTVALLLSFTLNLVLVIVVLLLLMQIFQIKNGILEPLIDGLHRDFVGLDEAVIERTINVDDQIPVQFDLPLNQSTSVVLTADVPIAANASFTLPGGGGMINGRVDIVLPEGLVLPIRLDMIVPVDTTIPIHLPVDVEIPLKETQLHEPFDNLRGLLQNYVCALDNLPDDWDEVPDFVLDALGGDVNLLAPTEECLHPWPGPSVEQEALPQRGESAEPESGTEPEDNAIIPPSNAPTATPMQDIGIITPPAQ